MKRFVHIKDNVVFAYGESMTGIIAENVIEVTEDPSSYLNKRYVDGNFLDPQVINYITIDSNSVAVSKDKTYFSSDITEGKDIIVDSLEAIDIGMVWDGTDFNPAPSLIPAANQDIIDEQIRQREAWMQEMKNQEIILSEE
jgi:hypothetical protein